MKKCPHCNRAVGPDCGETWTTCHCGEDAHVDCRDKCPQKPKDKERGYRRRPGRYR